MHMAVPPELTDGLLLDITSFGAIGRVFRRLFPITDSSGGKVNLFAGVLCLVMAQLPVAKGPSLLVLPCTILRQIYVSLVVLRILRSSIS